ncbi:P-loop containing nucleoside triphosphate hydrolase protein [Boletus edulis]|nr:P-loop containing nucleoside triphosphate hydrolase protein [Boletus edulis]
MSPPSSSQTSTLLLSFSRPPTATTSLLARFPPSHSSSFIVPSSSRLPTTHEASLSVISDDVIVTCLCKCFMSDTIYTNIGSSALVAINPHNGEAGSGKSETRCLAIKMLLELSVSNPGKKGSKLATQVAAAEFIIKSFGNARTLFNPNASRFGKYTKLQFTDKGCLCGIKSLDYYLERNQVAAVPL